MSMGDVRKGALGRAVKNVVRHFRGDIAMDGVEVTSMKAKIKEEGERPEEINLLDDILAVRNILELVDNDPETNYAIKLQALREAMREWL